MNITLSGKIINISNKSLNVFKKMHFCKPSKLDIEVYLLASFPDMELNTILSSKSSSELEDAINNVIKTEAIDYCGERFYTET